MSPWLLKTMSPVAHTEVHADACKMAAEVLVSSPDEADPASHRGHGMGSGGCLRWLHGLPPRWWGHCINGRADVAAGMEWRRHPSTYCALKCHTKVSHD
uniref:Uncharacterized protein n=1 Tax=Aegilops tauschii subsp. strangulata TaxID=200361 RepID=A0A453G325_AEGTS